MNTQIGESGHYWIPNIKKRIWVCKTCGAYMAPWDGFFDLPPEKRSVHHGGKHLKLLRGPSKCSFFKRFIPKYRKEYGDIISHSNGYIYAEKMLKLIVEN